MAQKILGPAWKPKPLYSSKRLSELAAAIKKLERQVRAAESKQSKSSAVRPEKKTPTQTSVKLH